jgi:hypothetical protein
MLMRKQVAVLVAAAALMASQAFSGIYYEATTSAEGRKGADMVNTNVKGWVAGDKAKIVFESSNNPMAKKGMYMITQDGGKAVYMVNPEEKTYFKWDLDSLVGMAGSMMKMMNLKFADPKVEKVGEELDGVIVGLPTIHYTYNISYTQSMKFMMMHKTTKVAKVQEVWSAPKLVDAALGIYLRKTPPSMGDEEYDKLLRAQMEAMKGFPLKVKTVQTDTDEKGKATTTTTTMEVTKLELSFATPDSTFEIPAGYKEAEMPAGPGSEK